MPLADGSYASVPNGRAEPGEVRLNRLLRLRVDEVRREGTALPRQIYDAVVAARSAYV